MTLIEDRIWEQSKCAVSSPLENQLALLDTRSNVYYSLDGIGPFLWNAIAEGASLPQLCTMALERYDVGARAAEEDIARWLAEMSRAGLVVERA